MEFECVTVSLNSIATDPSGVKEPLCNRCCQPECTNPIRKRKVFVVGQVREWNLFCVGHQVYMVTLCRGFVE